MRTVCSGCRHQRHLNTAFKCLHVCLGAFNSGVLSLNVHRAGAHLELPAGWVAKELQPGDARQYGMATTLRQVQFELGDVYM